MDQQQESDPFDVFGQEDDDDDNDNTIDNEGISWNSRQVLVSAANERIAQKKNNNGGTAVQKDAMEKGSEGSAVVSGIEPFQIPFWNPPLYLGPIQLVRSSSFGGGRAYVAAETLEPGTLVMVETPLIGWPTEQLGKPLDLVSIQHILESPYAETIVQMMEDLHPTKVGVDDNDEIDSIQVGNMMNELRRRYQDDNASSSLLQFLIHLCDHGQIRNRDGSAVSENDLLRLLLVLRYNGLESGIYCHTSMLNHDCFPNCVKFFPDTSFPSSSSTPYSEVRTTRRILAGESLTISYLSRTLCHASRRLHLWEQHRFDIGVDYLKGKHRQMELVANKLPPSRLVGSSMDETSPTRRVERTIEQLEALYQESLQVLEHPNNSSKTSIEARDDSSDWIADQIKALEVSCLELCNEAQVQLENDQHVLLVPCFRLHLDSCELVQRLQPSLLSTSQRRSVLVRQVVTAQRLLDLQKDYYNVGDGGSIQNTTTTHFDVARTYLDLANAIDEILANNPKLLYNLKQPMSELHTRQQQQQQQQQQLAKTTFAEWSLLEHTSRKEYERIRNLYPHDTEERIKKSAKTKT